MAKGDTQQTALFHMAVPVQTSGNACTWQWWHPGKFQANNLKQDTGT